MVKLQLSIHEEVQKSLKYNVSPLFEMAASLHVLAHPNALAVHHGWICDTLNYFDSEDLLEEWKYLSPIFQKAIPTFFAPRSSHQANGVDEQYDFLVDLSNEKFVQALQNVFAIENIRSDAPLSQVEKDIQEKPKAVKARFTLFLCTYLQFVFESKWEQIAPKLVNDIEKKAMACHSDHDLISIILQMFPLHQYDPKLRSVSFDPSYFPYSFLPKDNTITTVFLSPSWFVTETYFEVIHDRLYMTYPIASLP